jgi:hypothetical protein
MAQIGPATLVYSVEELRQRAETVIADAKGGSVFDARTCARIAELDESQIDGPSWHGFVDTRLFSPHLSGAGRRLHRDDPLLSGLREASGDADWAEGGFFEDEGFVYGIEESGRLLAAGNLTPFRGVPADVGLLTHPAARDRGLAKQMAVSMISDALPHVGIIRYRARLSNLPSLAIAKSLGFRERGCNLVARLSG